MQLLSPCWMLKYLCNNDSCGALRIPRVASFDGGLTARGGLARDGLACTCAASTVEDLLILGDPLLCRGCSEKKEEAGEGGGDMAERRPGLPGLLFTPLLSTHGALEAVLWRGPVIAGQVGVGGLCLLPLDVA